jgi:hypothetical protein
VWRPPGIRQVGAAVVRDVGADNEVNADQAEEDTTDEWHAHGVRLLSSNGTK